MTAPQQERMAAPAPPVRHGASRPAIAAGIIALALVPPLTGAYYTWTIASVLLLALFAMGFNLLLGYSGLLSFGHAAFFGVGAYVSAGVLLTWPSLPVAMVAGTVAATVVGAALGYLSLRHTDIYFAMLTLAFGMMVHSAIWRWRGVTGGDDGLTGIPRGIVGVPGLGFDVASLDRFYYVILVVTATAVWIIWRIVRSPLGLAFQGIRDDEVRVAYAGLPVRHIRLAGFTLSASFAGLAGALWSPLNTTAGPSVAHWTFSAEPVLASLLGGVQVFAGPIVGATLLFMLKQFVVQYTQYWLLVLGIIVIVLVLAFRGGVASVALRAAPTVRRLLTSWSAAGGRERGGGRDG